jgi:hypothetical protein
MRPMWDAPAARLEGSAPRVTEESYSPGVPTILRETTVATLRDHMDLVELFMSQRDPIWFRGAGDVAHACTPSLCRHPTITDGNDLIELEGRLLQRYRERSIPYSTPNARPERDAGWEHLFVMQHFGVPTRLLDWTESPYVGLYFALTSVAFDYKKDEAEKDVCVWVLLPELWNQQVLAHISYGGGILSIDQEHLNNYKPASGVDLMGTKPLAMFGLHNSPRIVAQRGVFTIFGKEPKPMEAVLADDGYEEDTLTRLTIPKAAVKTMLRGLTRIGVVDSMIYPDLGGLALELKRFYGYRV